MVTKKKKERLEKEHLAEQERSHLAKKKELLQKEKRLVENRRKEVERQAKIKATLETLSIRQIAQGCPFEAKLFVTVVKQLLTAKHHRLIQTKVHLQL